VTDAPYYSIGEVLSLLKLEHPELTLYRIRSMESEGIIEPLRTPSGYRKFSEQDVERLRWVLSGRASEQRSQQQELIGAVSMSAEELAAAVGADRRFVAELARLGLIEGIETEDGEVFDEHSLLIARTAVRLQSFGLDARHLRMYKVATDREAGVLRQLFAARLRKRGARRDQARAELAEVMMLGESLRRTLMRRDLGDQIV